ncbi:hypothetical protein D3C81_1539250 [compost metagenome]
MAIVRQRQIQRLLADMLLHLNHIQRIVLCAFHHVRQGENPRGQQPTAFQPFAQAHQFVFYLVKSGVQPLEKIVGRHKMLAVVTTYLLYSTVRRVRLRCGMGLAGTMDAY